MLMQASLFEGLSDENITTIKRHGTIRRYRKNTVIIERGDGANALYMILEGQVKAYVTGDDGKELILSQQGSGSVLGELALLADIPRTASVMTLENSECLVLSKSSFMQCLSDHPNISFNLIKVLANQVHTLTESVTDFALLNVYGRVVKILSDSAIEEGDQRITPKYTHQELADRVGASREMVSKILKDLKSGGYLRTEGKRYIIHRKLPDRW